MIPFLSEFLNFIFGRILEKIFPKKNENLEIIRLYDQRLREKEEKIENLQKVSSDKEMDVKRILSSLKNKGLSVKRLIEKYNKPLNAIFLSYSSQYVKNGTKNGNIIKESFLKSELKKYNAKSLGGTEFIIPPSNSPKNIKNNLQLKDWFEKNILKGRYCKLKLLTLVDLKNQVAWANYLPKKQKHNLHFTIGEVLDATDLFTNEEIIDSIAISEIIKDGDIGWLASRILSLRELEILHKNQQFIENELGNLPLRELAKDEQLPKMFKVLSAYFKNPSDVAKSIIEEAKFWNERLK